MSHAETVLCPNCGAPIELLPDHTCRWCRAVIVDTSSLSRSILSEAEAQVLRAQAFERVMRRWTLQPQGPWIDWDGPPDSPAMNLRPQFSDLLAVLRDGMGQPVIGELAADEALDRQFCRLVSGAMTGGGMAKLCGVVMAVALSPGTDARWKNEATAVALAVKQQLVGQGSWKHGLDYQAPMMLRQPVSPEDLRFPGLKALDAWVESKFDAAGIRYKRWVKA